MRKRDNFPRSLCSEERRKKTSLGDPGLSRRVDSFNAADKLGPQSPCVCLFVCPGLLLCSTPLVILCPAAVFLNHDFICCPLFRHPCFSLTSDILSTVTPFRRETRPLLSRLIYWPTFPDASVATRRLTRPTTTANVSANLTSIFFFSQIPVSRMKMFQSLSSYMI